jgi:hypothetical protein
MLKKGEKEMKKAILIIALLLVSIVTPAINMKYSHASEGPARFDVQWTNFAHYSGYAGNGPDGGSKMYHSGSYPVWKNFTIHYTGDSILTYVSVRYPETMPAFKPDYYEIKVYPEDGDREWSINVNLADRLVEFIAKAGSGMARSMYAIVSIRFIEGPTAEDCQTGHEFAVTVSEGDPQGQTFYLREYIDKTPPQNMITFPDADRPAEGVTPYTFLKDGTSGSIWVLMPNCTDRDIGWLWINGTASDDCSGIHRIEIWINGKYHGDATIIQKDGNKRVSWWWKVDPTKSSWWTAETWYEITARAYDNSVNDLLYAAPGHQNMPRTNYKDDMSWFFWIGVKGADIRVPAYWIPGNGELYLECTTGFAPYSQVEIWLENAFYGISSKLTTVTADENGRFTLTINHIPEVPRVPMPREGLPDSSRYYFAKAFSAKGNIEGRDRFDLIPWITYEDTDSPVKWKTTKTGNVGNTINVYGHGFLPSRHSRWDPYSDVYVEIVYTDVAPLQTWDWRTVFNGTGYNDYDLLRWYPRLNEVVLTTVRTDVNGYWKALNLVVPDSFGGQHAIYAREVEIRTDVGRSSPTPVPVLVVSGWPSLTEISAQAQAVIFDVWPTITVSPSTAITDQYVTINGRGLPLPKHYQLQKRWYNQEGWRTIQSSRDWCLVLDFGPFKEWVYENQRIRNNELDTAWMLEAWYPFAFHTPDIANRLDNPAWEGKLASATIDFETDRLEFNVGSKFLKVPMLPPSEYPVTVYYFDKVSTQFTYNYSARTMVSVIKDPLNIALDVGSIHFPGEIVDVFAQVDVDGIISDATLSFDLYKGESLVKSLPPNQINTGMYFATFTCPSGTGDYFIRATAYKDYGGMFTLYGSAVAGFTVNPTLSDLGASIIQLNSTVATLMTEVGQIKINLAAVEAKVVGIEGSIATINTTIGTIKTNVTNINAVITGLSKDAVAIHTDIGDLTVKLSDLNGVIDVKDDVATIKTVLGDVKGKVISLEGATATIQTDIGTITDKANSIQNNVGYQPITVGLSLFAALTAIAVAILILRKLYLK